MKEGRDMRYGVKDEVVVCKDSVRIFNLQVLGVS